MSGYGFKRDVDQTATVTRYELYKFIRNKKLVLFALVMGFLFAATTLGPILMGDGLPEDAAELMGGYTSWIMIVVVVGATLFASDALVSEFEDRTALVMFTRPIKKRSIFLGKFVAAVGFMAVFIAMYYFGAMAVTFAVTGEIASGSLLSMGIALLYMLACCSVAFLLSAFMKRGSTAAIMTFALLAFVFPMVSMMLGAFGIEPVFGLYYSSQAFDAVITGATTAPILDVDGAAVMINGREMMNFIPETGTAALVMVAWAGICGVIAMLRFRTREF